jgi:hypothetical protein
MDIFDLELGIGLLVGWLLLAVKIYAFALSLTYSNEAYLAAGKLNKPTWCIILGIALLLQLMGVMAVVYSPMILNLALTIAALVFLADVRPALSGLRRR